MDIFEVRDVTTGYDKKVVIENFNMTIPKGQITSIVGPNGCGKTTLLHTLTRVLKIKYGAVLMDGKDIFAMNTKNVAKRLSLLPQMSNAPDGLTVRELIGYGRHPHKKPFEGLNQWDYENIDWAVDVTGIKAFTDRPVSELSGGQKQRVWLAMALAQNTDIILLDEPTTYLDMKFQMEILNLLKSLNETADKTIVMVLHDINHASRFSDHMIALKEGGIRKLGKPETVMTESVLKEVFEVDAVISECPFTSRPIITSYQLKG
ncbi:ABC transporter ATP-binding protein [Salinicoccus sp. YB14-2]|uniref:ABC transporter ATP-binding protein n=1 Tax=Salinicoccus sp. YB14-2 TaxID=1572701 RepID=UPI0006915E57|nr:ABC transporter ATP-binding protein [Salinicoccus sp. YB14-2]